jgi:hypothetical protein
MINRVAPDVQAERLRAFLVRHHAAVGTYGWRGQTPHAIAARFLADAAFEEIGLADWLQSPDGLLIRQVAARVLPPWQAFELELLVDAVILAAEDQRRQSRTAFGAAIVGLTSTFLILLLLFREGRVNKR